MPPWQSLAEFQASPAFTSEMKSWPAFRLSRYIDAFRAVWNMMKSQGASDAETEANAHALAFTSARRYQPMPSNATLESDIHYFTPLQQFQFSGGGQAQDMSFDHLLANLPTISAAVAGNSFNLNHDATEPTGTILQLLLPKDTPAEVQAKLPPGTPFVVAASYFVGTPESIKATKTISAEWQQTKRADGRTEVVFVDSFCVTDGPAADTTLGVGKVAEVKVEVDAPTKIPLPPSGQAGTTLMTAQPPNDTAALTAPDAEARFASLQGELDREKKTRKNAELNFIAMQAEVSTMKKLVEEMKSAAADREAEEAALLLVRDGKATADQTAYFAQMFKDMGKDRFAELASRLQVTSLGAYGAKAMAAIPENPEAVKAYKERMTRILAEA